MTPRTSWKKIVLTPLILCLTLLSSPSTSLAAEVDAKQPEAKITATFKNVENMVDGLAASVKEMSRVLKEGKQLAAAVDKQFSDMEKKFSNSLSELSDGSAIMNDMAANIEEMKGYIEYARQKKRTTTDKRKQQFWLEDAEYWEEQVKKANLLRDRILKGRNLLSDQITQLGDQKDIIKALMRREHGSQTIRIMAQVAEDLDAINQELSTILRATEQDAGMISN